MFRKWIKYVLPIFCIYMILLNLYTFHLATSLQGDARIINYAGLVRGVTQRLIKLELADQPNDNIIQELDTIIEGLQGLPNYLDLIYMTDSTFQKSLSELINIWDKTKILIYDLRSGSENQNELVRISENHFQIANQMVSYAEIFSAKKTDRLSQAKTIFYICSVFFGFFLCIEVLHIIHLQFSNQKLSYLAYTDKKTGLPNRARCEQVLDYYKHNQVPNGITCIMIDLDNLKSTNDTYGHIMGDELIRSFGVILSQTVTAYGFAGRLGGDEFLAIFENHQEKIGDLFIKILDEKIKEYNSSSEKIEISFSYGIAVSNEESTENIPAAKLLEIADAKMYEQKKQKKQLEK